MKPETLLPTLLLLAAPAWAQEHPLFSAYPGSKLEEHVVKEFDEYELPVGQLLNGRYVKSENLEGKFTVIRYDNPPQRSTLELMRNYEKAFAQSGFQTLYSCKGQQCGSGCVNLKGLQYYCLESETRYWAGKLPRPEGDAYLALLVTGDQSRVNIIEVKAMDTPVKGSAAPAPAAAPAAAVKSEAAASGPAPSGGSGRAAQQLESGVISGLNKLGFQAKGGKASDPGDIIVEGKIQTTPLAGDGDTRWKWARSVATISLKDGKTGKIFLRFEATDRQASSGYDEAARRSQAELAQKVAAQVHSAVTDYFENQ